MYQALILCTLVLVFLSALLSESHIYIPVNNLYGLTDNSPISISNFLLNPPVCLFFCVRCVWGLTLRRKTPRPSPTPEYWLRWRTDWRMLCVLNTRTHINVHTVDGSCDFCQKDRRGRGRINNMIDRRPWASLTWRAEERESQYPTVSHKEKSIYCI